MSRQLMSGSEMDAEILLIDTELFIVEVKNRVHLWNTACPDYHDRTKKRSSWIEIAKVFFNTFDEKTDAERSDICK